jgi:tetratricopeptide (TPR) repeat protein
VTASSPAEDGGRRPTAPTPEVSSVMPLPAPRPSNRKRQLLLLALALALLLLGGGSAGWWWFHRPVLDPPIPDGIQEEEVRQLIEQQRDKIRANPRSANAWGELGMTLLSHLFDREADRCFAEAARLDPSAARWPYARSLIALKRDPDQAVPLLRQAANSAGTSWPQYRATVRLQLGEALLERQNLDEAEALFRDELRREPGDPRAALDLGLVLLARGEEEEAGAMLTLARSSPNAKKTATAQLAALARSRHETALADELAKEASALPADLPWPDPILDEAFRIQVGKRGRFRIGEQLERQHLYAEAAQVYLEMIEKDPGNARAYVLAGINFARLKDYDRALPLLHQGIRLDPESANAHYTLALAQFSRAERESAETPSSSRTREWFQEALEHAIRATELKPDHAGAFMVWGLSLKHLGDLPGALVPLRRGIACRPEDFELQLALGEVLLATGNVQEAREHLENAQRLDTQDPRLRKALERLAERGK